MLTYNMDQRGNLPLYEYLYRCIRADILSGTIHAQEWLPSKRALAEHLHISVITVEAAYQQLEAEGYVYARPKRGFFVCPVETFSVPAVQPLLSKDPPPPVWQLDLSRNQADASLFPTSIWARLTRQVLADLRSGRVDMVLLPAEWNEEAEGLRSEHIYTEELVLAAGGEIAGRMTILAEGDAQDRDDIIYLEKLPLFNAKGEIIG